MAVAPQTAQSARQATIRSYTDTAESYEGDWHAAFTLDDIPLGPFDERLLAWINYQLSASYTELNGAMQAYAAGQGAYNWSSMGTNIPPKVVGGVNRLILAGDDGYAVDFIGGQMRVNFAATPAKNFLGQFANKLYVNGVITAGPDGVALDATNFLRMANADWPYRNTAITIAGQIKFDTATDGAARFLHQIDPGGNDALAMFVGSGADKLSLFAGFGGSSGNTTATSAIVADQWFDFVASAGPDGCFIGINGLVEASRTEALAAAASLVNYHGIGGTASSTGNGANASPMKGRVRSLVVLARAVEPGALVAGLPFPVSTFALAALGDSHTLNNSYGVTQAQFYPQVVTGRLGYRQWLPRNFGVSGNTTAQMFNRVAQTVAYGAPRIANIYGGTNDASGNTTVSASPTPTDTVFTVASNISRYAASGWITVAGEQAQILSIAGSQITLTAPLAAGAPATGAAVAIDTQKNLEAIVTYWQGQGVTRIALMGQHYLNFASGGDTTSTQASGQAALRASQAAAAASTGAVFIDLYEIMRQLILAGTYTQGDDLAWHVAVGNTHLNATGERILADAFEATMRTQGWIT